MWQKEMSQILGILNHFDNILVLNFEYFITLFLQNFVLVPLLANLNRFLTVGQHLYYTLFLQ